MRYLVDGPPLSYKDSATSARSFCFYSDVIRASTDSVDSRYRIDPDVTHPPHRDAVLSRESPHLQRRSERIEIVYELVSLVAKMVEARTPGLGLGSGVCT